MVCTQLMKLAKKMWQDDCGAVIATEYLALGSIVALGGVTGLVSMRDATNAEMQEYGNSVREIRQQYSVQGQKNGVASTPGSAAQDTGASNCFVTP